MRNAQDDLGGAKTLYVNASYDEALGVLDKQAAGVGLIGATAAELHHYRALCLIALGRAAEADQAIALSVSADPFSVPDTSELAPRVASVFTAARATAGARRRTRRAGRGPGTDAEGRPGGGP